MTPEQEKKEREKFKEYFWNKNPDANLKREDWVWVHHDLQETWLERARLEYEHLEKITSDPKFAGLLFIEPGCFDEEESNE